MNLHEYYRETTNDKIRQASQEQLFRHMPNRKTAAIYTSVLGGNSYLGTKNPHVEGVSNQFEI
jgi:hypothetical protein